MAAYTIQRLARSDENGKRLWEEFVRDNSDATFFHRVEWLAIQEDIFGHRAHFLYAEGDGRLEGILPLAEVRSWLFGNSLVSLPFASYGGVVARTEGAALALVVEAQRLARELRVDFLELRNTSRRHAEWPTQELYVAFRMSIPAVLDDKMLCIPQKRRNMIRKAQKQGLRAVPNDSVERFFPVFAANARDHGTPTLPRVYFEQLTKSFGSDCAILSVDDANGRCISSIMCFFHRGEVLAYYAGELPEARKLAANDLKYWEVMKWAQARGCIRFDIGRSKRGTGSFDFKTLWGFTAHPLYYQYALNGRDSVPQNNPSNPKYRLMIRAWQRLPLPVANVIGPLVVRALG